LLLILLPHALALFLKLVTARDCRASRSSFWYLGSSFAKRAFLKSDQKVLNLFKKETKRKLPHTLL